MASQVDVTLPPDNERPSKAEFRAQFATISAEITALQRSLNAAFREGFDRDIEQTVREIVDLNRAHGGITVTGGAVAQSSIGTSYVKLTAFDADGGESRNVTESNSNDRLTVLVGGLYQVKFNASFSGSASTKFTLSVHVNQAEPSNKVVTARALGTGGDIGAVASAGQLRLVENDQVELFVKADGASKSVTVEEAHLNVYRIDD